MKHKLPNIFKRILRLKFLSVISLFLIQSALVAQTPGSIYKPSSTAFGKSILDPNGDGFTSPTTAGFAGTDYGTGSELRMIPLPVFQSEPLNDISTGAGGGHTDIASAGGPHSCYILKRTVNGVDYILVRFRIGGASTASKGYSLLMETDRQFGQLLSPNNLGFDREIVFETGNNGRVAIYKHEFGNSGQLIASYNVNEYSQRSVALSTAGGNPDFFYDFFVPLAAIDADDLVRICAVTVTSASSGITGTISDFNGINDKEYGNNILLLQEVLINSFPEIDLNDLDENFDASGWVVKTVPPTVYSWLIPSSNSISGTSTEANGTTIEIFQNGTSIGTATVTNNAWTLTGVSGLLAGDVITASALASGKSLSDLSVGVTVLSAVEPCNLVAPEITGRDNGQRRLSGSAPPNSVVTIYRINADGSIVQATTDNNSGTNPTTANSSGVWGPISRFGTNQTDFTNTSYIAKATLNGCISDYSLINAGSNNVATTAPQVVTTNISESNSPVAVTVKNLHASNANLYFYVNGQLQEIKNNIATLDEVIFSYTGFMVGDTVYARAIGTATNSTLSGLSNKVAVQGATQAQTQPPTITGIYTAGSNKTITGISLESAGTVITIYKNGTLIGSDTVSAFGTWQLTGQTFATNDVLTAKAKAISKSLSELSNAVTVVASLPSAPEISGDYTVGNTTISGTDGSGLVIILVDGSPIGSVIPDGSGNWSLSGINVEDLYRGAAITATNIVGGIESESSSEKIVTGVASFEITRENGDPIGTVVSGDVIMVRIKAKDNVGGTGNDFTLFEQNVTLLSTTPVLLGEGETDNFETGVLGESQPKNIALGGAGNDKKILVINPNDPLAFGETTVNVLPAVWIGRENGVPQQELEAHNQSANWTHGRVPMRGASIQFADDAYQDMVLEDEYYWQDVNFALSDKNIVLNNNSLSVQSFTNRTTNVVKTIGNGKLKMKLDSGESTLFPVANSVNNHLVITNNTNDSDTFSVRVFDDFLINGTLGETIDGKFVKRTWDISKSTANSGNGIDFEFYWNENEEEGDEFESYDLFHYKSGRWMKEGELVVEDLISGNKKGVLTNYIGTFSPFSIGDESGVALPVELLYFTAKSLDNKYIVLDWATATEINNEGFEVQKSIDGLNFKSTGWVAGAGNFVGKTNYDFIDKEVVPAQIYYYRLKQIDFDGKFEYSKIVAASVYKLSDVQQINIYPNPAKDFVKFDFDTGNENIVSVTVHNAIGNQVFFSNQSHQNQIDLTGLPSGIYMVSVMTTNHTFSRKLNILK